MIDKESLLRRKLNEVLNALCRTPRKERQSEYIREIKNITDKIIICKVNGLLNKRPRQWRKAILKIKEKIDVRDTYGMAQYK